ncbi:MAG: helix-turn-helix transcriptional regulator [Gammaproteobacteria bacterium]|nr:helix-turn-helix transcriptional regulator [Gammaproteobacteria bacterium]
MKLKIRQLRKAKGLTQDYVAALLGVSIPHLSEMERELKNINKHQLSKLREIYGVPVWELFEFEDGSDEQILAKTIGKLTDSNKDVVKNLASDLLKSQERD